MVQRARDAICLGAMFWKSGTLRRVSSASTTGLLRDSRRILALTGQLHRGFLSTARQGCHVPTSPGDAHPARSTLVPAAGVAGQAGPTATPWPMRWLPPAFARSVTRRG